ncbi:MAG: 50S ribosomal protein L5 [Bacteroidetes bacterium]|nr:50S ribosomal protein L5 [Bacteroidota bacterium]
MAYEVRLQKEFQENIIPALKQKFGYQNVMEVPRLEKIVINRGLGAAVSDKKLIDQALEEFALITGQKPVVAKSRYDISNFKLRKGMPIGCMVTLRRERMYEFLDRFVNVAAPRMRDFRGLPTNGFDGRGNYSLGIKEQIIFPEIDVDKIYKIAGMDVTFVTSAKTDEEAMELLRLFGLPFKGNTILV